MKKVYRCGFTLIETLVALAIIVVLMALLFPVLAAARSNGKLSSCASNLHHVGLALRMYQADYDDLPAYQVVRHVSGEALLIPYAKDKEVFHCPSEWNNGTRGRYMFNTL